MESSVFSGSTAIEMIATGAIVASKTNPRKTFDDAALAELAQSIRESGVQVPLTVRTDLTRAGSAEEYELIAGERRWRAARQIGLKELPCIVADGMTDDQVRDMQTIENLQREDLHPVEEAEAYQALIEHAQGWRKLDEPEREGRTLTAEDIARRVGKTTAYVAQRLKLLTLGIDAKLLFSRGHLTLGHALLLARITEKDQDRALRWMLNSDPRQDKRALTEIVKIALANRNGGEDDVTPGECRYCASTEEELQEPPRGSWVDAERTICNNPACLEQHQEELEEAKHPHVPNIAKYMRGDGRLIDATEAQLKRWIEANVLLKLADAPWQLADAELTAAGACTVCPKRSGSNAALFSDLTAAEDVCLDPECFAAKQDATVKRHKLEARKAGAEALLKLSAKRSCDKLQEPVLVKKDGSMQVTAKTIREGQWVPAQPKSCGDVIQGLMVDGPDKGKILTVCANQTCKKHKHRVESAASRGGSGGGESYEEREAREEKLKAAYMAAETPVRLAVFAAVREKAAPDAEDLLRVLAKGANARGSSGSMVCELRGLSLPKCEAAWQRNEAAEKILLGEIDKRKGKELLSLVFDLLYASIVPPEGWKHGRRQEDRRALWALAKQFGVNADAIAKQHEPKPEKPAKPKAGKPAAKRVAQENAAKAKAKAAAKKAPAKKAAKA